MKKIIYAACCALAFVACKKDNPADYRELFNGTYWTGEYRENGIMYQYCMKFNIEDSTVVFNVALAAGISQSYGTFRADYQAKKISVMIQNGYILADISFTGAGKFTAFSIDPESVTNPHFLDGELNNGAPPKPGTVWKGSSFDGTVPMSIFFGDGDKAQIIAPAGNQLMTYFTRGRLIHLKPGSGYAFNVYTGILKDTAMEGTVLIIGQPFIILGQKSWAVSLQH